MPRLAQVLTAVAVAHAALAATVATTAHAAVLPVSVTITGQQQTSWSQPKWYGLRDCHNLYWAEADGGRKLEFSVRGDGELQTGAGVTLLRWRGEGLSSDAPVDQNAVVTTRYYDLSGSDPGPCGGGSPAVLKDASACGSRKVPHRVGVVLHAGTVRVDANEDRPRVAPACGPFVGSCLRRPGGFEALTQPYSLKPLRRGRTLEVTASHRCARTVQSGTLRTIHGGRVTWKLTIRPSGAWRRR